MKYRVMNILNMNVCRQELTETLKAANSYLIDLKNLTEKLNSAERQICCTSKEAEDAIETAVTDLLVNISTILDMRKKSLLKKVEDVKRKGLGPIKECQDDILLKTNKTNQFIDEIECLLNGRINSLEEFSEKCNELGRLPEIPELKEVPFISFQYNTTSLCDLLDVCSKFGQVSKIAPIQISQTTEKPGAIVVEWQNVENDERGIDIQEFRLQKAFGDVRVQKHLSANFADCFVGLETQFLVKDLQADQPYSFRVCCRYEGSTEWSPWSLPQVALTTIKPFSWADNADFMLANENKIACPIKESPSLLLSDGPQFSVGDCIEFTYLNFDNKCSTIGLIHSQSRHINKIKSLDHSYFSVDSTGEIFVNGVHKSTKLPEAFKGQKICFTCEPVSNNKVRVSVDSCDKRVTYDWNINKTDKLYFAAILNSPDSKIMIE